MQWRVLDSAHQKRNLAEYEGYLEVDEALVDALCEVVAQLITDVERLLATVEKDAAPKR
ncbi:hypothetical protein D9M68_951880 [compost metagenome]